MKRSKAFSFIELLVVLAIMTAILAVGIPQYSRYLTRQKLRTDANLVASAFQRTQEASRRIGIFLNLAPAPAPPNSVALVSAPEGIIWSNTLSQVTTIVTTPPAGPLTGCTGAAGFEFSDGTALVLNPSGNLVQCNGTAMGVPRQTITLSDRYGDRFIITVDTRTGNISGP